jgi:hypothetical protein
VKEVTGNVANNCKSIFNVRSKIGAMREWIKSRIRLWNSILTPLLPQYEQVSSDCRWGIIMEILDLYFSSFFNIFIVIHI